MPRLRRKGKTFRQGATEPRDLMGSVAYWKARFQDAIAAGELPIRVERSSVRNFIGFLIAQGETRWPGDERME